MNTLHLCNRIDITHISSILSLSPSGWTLKSDACVVTIKTVGKISLQTNCQTTKHGRISRKTITLNTHDPVAINNLTNNLNRYIIRVYTTQDCQIIGSLQYPASLTIDDNLHTKTLTFTTQSPLL